MVQLIRAASWRRMALALAAMLVVTALSPVAVAQNEPVATEEAASDLAPTDNASGQNRLNPMVGGPLHLNPNVAPPPDPTPVTPPATDSEGAAATAEPEPEADSADAINDPEQAAADEITTAQGAGQPNRQQQRSENDPQPVESAQAAGGGESAETGDGGAGSAGGSGGTIIQSAGITGNNRGSEINVNDCAYGSVQIDGGTIVNATDVSLSADGGTAVSTANGGDDNIVQAGGAIASRIISAGNGGAAGSDADGGTIITGAMITGNNRGHEVNFADCPAGRGDAVLIIDAGDVSNTTSIDISADGGTAIGDASGGDGNAGITGALGDAVAGNGGSADASADGGTIITSAMITGNNRGNTINVGEAAGSGPTSGGGRGSGGTAYSCLGGAVTMVIDGGNISNNTSIDLSADGGTAISDASGGDDNLGLGRDVAAGNGGSADANADGGTIITSAILTGNNRGNSISVGNVSGCAPVPAPAPNPAPVPESHAPKDQAGPKPTAPKQISSSGGRGPAVAVRALPDTGTGPVAESVVYPLSLVVAVALVSLGFIATGRRWLNPVRSSSGPASARAQANASAGRE